MADEDPNIALLSVPLLMYIGIGQLATAQPSNTIADPGTALTSEQVVNNLVRRNLESAQALVAYQGPVFIGLNTAASWVPEARGWWWM